MAPKRRTPMEEPQFASSSSEEDIAASGEDEEEKEGEEEEDEEEEEDHSSDQEDEAQGMPSKLSSPPFHTQTSKKPDSTTQQPDSDSEFETDSESESESELQVKNGISKPVASKPMEKAPPPKATKPRSETLKSAVGEKRVSEADRTPTEDSKRAKVKDSEAGGKKSEDAKKQLFQRVWSEDDEIAVLKGIIEFNETKGIDPAKDMNLFYDFIKKSLHFDVTLAQLKDKVWRLKKKFGHHVVKGKKGEDKIFAKPHDQKAFKLWKQIWGSEKSGGVGVQSSDAKPNGKAKQGRKSLAELKAELGLNSGKEEEKTEKAEVDVGRTASMLKKIVDFGRIADYVMTKGLDLPDEPKKAEMEEKWKKLHVEEVELFLKKTELIIEQTKLMLEAYKAQED
ncbi:hypothetical protein K2173_003994 [Erythroxylum novogranatense]|uniref:Uncharacterized protein n=1 Tax=Erythroxylum novogranatense TaxID=1862640 RepID=A0AAV8SK75_9ROSI|nr:hypothetical protein K2173_003994 [Erythroxylum novogranatense]